MKNFKTVKSIFLFSFLIAASHLSYAGLFISRTPAFEGVVTDAETGEPIENAIVSIQFYKTILDFHGGIRSSGSPEIVLTDTNGVYKLKPRIWFSVFGVEKYRMRVVHLNYFQNPVQTGLIESIYETKKKFLDRKKIKINVTLIKRDGHAKPKSVKDYITFTSKGADVQIFKDDYFYLLGAKIVLNDVSFLKQISSISEKGLLSFIGEINSRSKKRLIDDFRSSDR